MRFFYDDKIKEAVNLDDVSYIYLNDEELTFQMKSDDRETSFEYESEQDAMDAWAALKKYLHQINIEERGK